MKSTTKKLVVILGPTASGKTSLGLKIAKELNTEIISSDSRQFYKELKIGSAPPSKIELETIKHHFVQHLSVRDNYSIGQFEKDAIKKITFLFKKHDIILMIGGSGLYMDVVCDGIDSIPKTPKNIRDSINLKFEKKGVEWLNREVKRIDPLFYNNVDKHNTQRLKRCIEVFETTGKQISSYYNKARKKRNFEIIKIGISTDREKLYKKINERVDLMIKNGLIKEAKSLLKYRDQNALNTVGYKELFNYFDKNYSKEFAINEIKKNTRRFAKRQITWFRKDKKIKWFVRNELNQIFDFIAK
tara:strand:+ start:5096 stop:5998 length:903 start_codon:yes stop_codon:yes gene_type:complete